MSIPAPIHGLPSQIWGWLNQPHLQAAQLQERLAYTVVFSEQGFAAGEQELREDYWPNRVPVCWLGGPAIMAAGESWPRNSAGEPLAHIACFELSGVAGALDAEGKRQWGQQLSEGLPTEGYLQIFHDLQTYGYEAEDGQTEGWLVRWLHPSAELEIRDAPADLDLPEPACQVGLPMASFSPPSSLDGDYIEAQFDAAEHAIEEYQASWTLQRTGDPDSFPVPVTHLYGHSQAGQEVPCQEVLPEVLPLTAEQDDYRLIADIESWTSLAGWFGDASPLEVWMRQSDLQKHDYTMAWCMIRTD
ncbi:DUF1963 domain-containing protein [Micrococcoides hystricis]|uniref:DUF1963 domain-containing protein n=1 Tax=Micrococcoides hystricis TaxID=1572761 RepID=A0ABV6P9P3_9MICC